ncbi:protein-ribulosamine 3-kinase [Microdochium nivale]|nr:protein-ribulosamine 3-kinase [Microdochium nivale]
MIDGQKNRFGKAYINAYLRKVPPSEPADEFDDRLAMYNLRDDVLNSGLNSERGYLRERIKGTMRRLIFKYSE